MEQQKLFNLTKYFPTKLCGKPYQAETLNSDLHTNQTCINCFVIMNSVALWWHDNQGSLTMKSHKKLIIANWLFEHCHSRKTLNS